jgi:NAD(P)-dependent dehydrogenase (short-subunit alcohol dehydrogenase family)
MGRLQDKVIIVTGSSSGFGRGVAKACAAEGTRTVVSHG